MFAGAGTDLPREGGQLDFEERDTDGRGQVKDRAARGGMDEAHQIAPCEAVLHRGEGTLAVKAPDFVQDRL